MAQPAKHADIAKIDWLLGKWKSTSAKGFFLEAETILYEEEMQYTHTGEPFLIYNSSTKRTDNGEPLHKECGFLKNLPETNKLAFMVAHFYGQTELSEGEVDGQKLTLESKELSGIAFGTGGYATKVIRKLEKVDENTLKSVVSMASPKFPLHEHLHVTYKRCE